MHQGVKLVGTEGIFECDSQYRGGRGCLKEEPMRTWNLGIKYRERDKRNKVHWRGYFQSSIADFAENLLFLENGGVIADLGSPVRTTTAGTSTVCSRQMISARA